jgi:hypothetical protein
MNDMEDLLNESSWDAIRSIKSKRLHFVDTTNAFAGGELCTGPSPLAIKPKPVPVYMNGVIKNHLEYSFHPTAGGQAMLALRLLHAVK